MDLKRCQAEGAVTQKESGTDNDNGAKILAGWTVIGIIDDSIMISEPPNYTETKTIRKGDTFKGVLIKKINSSNKTVMTDKGEIKLH